jgi:redox-sensing transcriptional repressor
MRSPQIPDVAVRRLPLYLRALTILAREGKEITSSQELGQRLGLSSAQIRKDLSYFGGFGKQGTGYEIPYLTAQLRRILNLERRWDMALVGAGDLGHALLRYPGFRSMGFRIAAVFDSDPQKVGTRLSGLEVLDSEQLSKTVAAMRLQIGVVAVPASEAQAVAEALVAGGVRAILNYAPITLDLPERVRVSHLDPVAGLQAMTFYLT